MGRTSRVLTLMIGCWLGIGAARAQDFDVAAEVDRTRVRDGQLVQLSIVVSGAASGQVSRPDASRLADFDILGGPSITSSFRWVNGRTASSRTFTYTLRPRR
ncbi:MAG TPA: BatD family protein, partial [Candidatus Polarisedimenticolia bacterium]|nr:BatD family protein [Candidatus Polarisedimenticolia bacterium]